MLVALTALTSLAADLPLPGRTSQTFDLWDRPVHVEFGSAAIQVPSFSFGPNLVPRLNLNATISVRIPDTRFVVGLHGAQMGRGNRVSSTRGEVFAGYRLSPDFCRWVWHANLGVATDARWRGGVAVGPVVALNARWYATRGTYLSATARVAPVFAYTPETFSRPAQISNPGGTGLLVALGSRFGPRRGREQPQE